MPKQPKPLRPVIRVRVTKFDIKHGTQSDCHSCPVARAVNRALKHRYCTEVSGYSVRVYTKHGYFRVERYKSPTRVSTFIGKFDSGMTVKPFTFTLRKRHALH